MTKRRGSKPRVAGQPAKAPEAQPDGSVDSAPSEPNARTTERDAKPKPPQADVYPDKVKTSSKNDAAVQAFIRG